MLAVVSALKVSVNVPPLAVPSIATCCFSLATATAARVIEQSTREPVRLAELPVIAGWLVPTIVPANVAVQLGAVPVTVILPAPMLASPSRAAWTVAAAAL